jgi:hypothetical protein
MLVRVIGTGTEFIQDSVNERTIEVVSDHEILDFPMQRDELTFSFFHGKNATNRCTAFLFQQKTLYQICYMEGSKDFFRPKNTYNIIVLHFF